MSTKFDVIYTDGTEDTYTVRPVHILKVERSKGGLTASIESSYMLAFLASGSTAKFDDWIETVEDIVPVEQDVPLVDGETTFLGE